MEGFSLDQAARILDAGKSEISELIDQAAADIALQVRTDVLIIEDEPLIAMDLKKLVENLGHRVSGIARTHQQAVKLAAKSRPGLVLADIQLADDSSGIDAINEILTTMEVPVIFITAFPERLLTGQRPEPAFLITKPFMPDMLKAIIGQALFFDTKAQPSTKVAAAGSVRRCPDFPGNQMGQAAFGSMTYDPMRDLDEERDAYYPFQRAMLLEVRRRPMYCRLSPLRYLRSSA